ncbi:MAG: YopX family protein [Nitrospiria bacterium]
MRPIKFRAWSTHHNKNEMIVLDPYNRPRFAPAGALQDLVESENWKVMQFTGIKDENNKEIYEGDVVAFLSSLNKDNIPLITKVVRFRDGCYNIRPGMIKRGIKVIGNIYENPELLSPNSRNDG